MFKISFLCLLLLLVAGQVSCAIRLLDNNFGYGLYPYDSFDLGFRPLFNFPRLRLHPFAPLEKELASEESYHVGKDGFQSSLDVRGFQPSEITVKTVDNTVVIEGKHEEKEDEHGLISRHFIRKYSLPKGYDPNKVVSTLSSDGVLTIKVPAPPVSETSPVERIVQIHQTGPAINDNGNKASSNEKTTTESKPDEKENSVDS